VQLDLLVLERRVRLVYRVISVLQVQLDLLVLERQVRLVYKVQQGRLEVLRVKPVRLVYRV
jgi:ABC-type uncharacterized transport system permease subunit